MRGVAWLGVLALAGCVDRRDDPSRAQHTQQVETSQREGDGRALSSNERAAARTPASPDLCALELARVKQEAAQPGAPQLESHRVELLGRARSTPLWFRRAPEHSADAATGRLWEALEREDDPANEIKRVLGAGSGNLARRRELLLREGYLYAERPILALRLTQMLRLDHLFDEPVVMVQRGAQLLRAVRKKDRYVLEDAAQSEARLLLFDRVWLPESQPGPALHVDLAELTAQLASARLRIVQAGEDELIARASYARAGAPDVEADWLLRVEADGRARLDCESVAPDQRAALAAARSAALTRHRLVRPILAAIDDMIERGLPFDEPKTEEGQQDGKLRVGFREAYEQGASSYEFNGDRYPVFDGLGRPRVPQVCIDFITDALDAATGGNWAPRGQARKRTRGALHFPSLQLDNPRSVESVVQFASEHPEWFDVVQLEEAERVPLRQRQEFFEALGRAVGRYRVGDIVFINGLRSDQRLHFHSFFVAAVDPLTGFPTLLAANAGRPQLRTWEGEMANAPRRYIVARVRLKDELLSLAYRQARERPGVPLSLFAAADTPAAVD